jgi:iron-sulfur cluster assembly accessory protein
MTTHSSNTESMAKAAGNVPPVSMTSPAIAYAQQQLADIPDAKGLRFGIKASGCSGWSYQLAPALTVNEDDIEVHLAENLTLFIDADSLDYVHGTTIDFVQQGLNRQFRFDNPNVESECGCGESFTVK